MTSGIVDIIICNFAVFILNVYCALVVLFVFCYNHLTYYCLVLLVLVLLLLQLSGETSLALSHLFLYIVYYLTDQLVVIYYMLQPYVLDHCHLLPHNRESLSKLLTQVLAAQHN